jgi:transcriptional regulator with XRE-family HTH domain
MSENKLPNLIDKHVGRRIRWRRRELKLSQEKLGEMLGLTFQQVQKYEKGVNRISAGRLFEVGKMLDVGINYFYQGVEEVGDLAAMGLNEDGDDSDLAGMIDANAIDLVTAFQSIPDPRLRKSLLDAVKAAAESFSRNAAHREESEEEEV